MVPYYRSKERQEELLTVLKGWVGTPHRHLVAVKGLGADCCLFVWEVLREVGTVAMKNIPNVPRQHGHINYPPDRALHSREEVILTAMRGMSFLIEIPKQQIPMNGDICTYQFGRSTAHIGIYYNGDIYHSLTGSEVLPQSFEDKKMKKRLTAIFRIMEEEE